MLITILVTFFVSIAWAVVWGFVVDGLGLSEIDFTNPWKEALLFCIGGPFVVLLYFAFHFEDAFKKHKVKEKIQNWFMH